MQQEFEALRQYQAALSHVNTTEDQFVLNLLAGEPTKQALEQQSSSPGWQLFAGISKPTGIEYKTSALATLRNFFPVNVLEKL